MPARYAVGVDLGGTKIMAAVVKAATGEVIGSDRKRTRAERGAAFLVERLNDVVDGALAKARVKASDLAGIGIGAAGQVDRASGVLISAPNLAYDTANLPLAAELRHHFGVPVVVGNDVEVAAIGEQRFGAGRDGANFLCVFVGTGIGGGLVIDGQLYRGATGTAGEIGHIVVDAGGRHCGCGQRGCLEAYASRSAITRTLLGEIQRGRPSVLRELLAGGEPGVGSAAIRSGLIAQAVAADDELTMSVLDEAAAYLGIGLASAINLVNPRRIILGGGLIEAVDFFFEAVSRNARQGALPVPGGQIEIVRTGLGDNSGVVGAAVMAAEAATR
ncbi:MAG: ROK family protein [Chloroflexi bacterium]|nr:ROK family protein [Chloroflexota bacterium]